MDLAPNAGLVLRLRELRESDLLVDLFTRGLGRLTAVARGAKRSRRRFLGLLLSGHLLELGLSAGRSGDLWRLERAALLRDHQRLRWDHRRFMAAAPVWELLLRATAPHDPLPAALDLALVTLAGLEQAETSSQMGSALVVFLLLLLDHLGYGLTLDGCLECGRPASEISRPRLSHHGGLICPSCAGPGGHLEVPAGLIKALAAVRGLTPAMLGRLRLSRGLIVPALAFLFPFWQRICGHDLPALGLARGFLSRPAAAAAA